MAESTQADRTPDQAKVDAKTALDAGATKIVLTLQDDGNWTIKVTQP